MFLSSIVNQYMQVVKHAWHEERTVVEPVPEALKAMGDQVFCCAEVEPGVDCRRELH